VEIGACYSKRDERRKIMVVRDDVQRRNYEAWKIGKRWKLQAEILAGKSEARNRNYALDLTRKRVFSHTY
jgi:hypothetical protein